MKLVQYHINPCQSCDQIANLLRGMDLSHIHWEKVDTSNLELAHLQKTQVKTVPTLILYDNQGNEIKRKSGALTKKQLEVFLGLESN